MSNDLLCEIKNIEKDPKHQGRVIISVRFKKGRSSWIQAFSFLNPDRQISLEEFKASLLEQHHNGKIRIEKPVDPFASVKRAMKEKHRFTIDISPKKDVET